jgi:hypothetical protein
MSIRKMAIQIYTNKLNAEANAKLPIRLRRKLGLR